MKNLIPLFFFAAIQDNDIDAVFAAISQNPDVLDAVNEQGHTGLQVAALYGNLPIVSLLINLGADLSVKDNQGRTLAELAKFYDQPEIAKLFKHQSQLFQLMNRDKTAVTALVNRTRKPDPGLVVKEALDHLEKNDLDQAIHLFEIASQLFKINKGKHSIEYINCQKALESCLAKQKKLDMPGKK